MKAAAATKLPGKGSKSKIDIAAAKAAICSVLKTPKIVADRYGMLNGAKPEGEALHTCCKGPGHKSKGDTNPSFKLDTSHETGRVTGHCWVCGWHGSSPIDIAGAVRLGMWHELKGQDFRDALEEAARVAGVDLSKFAVAKGRPRKPLTPELVDQMATIRSRLLLLTSVPDGRTEPHWHAEVADYLRSRGLDPAKIDAIQHVGASGPEAMVAGCLGPDVTMVGTKPLGVVSRKEGSWDATGHRLILPLFAAGGKLAGLVGRATDGVGDPKSLGASGVSPVGAVMANPLAKVALASRDTLAERWLAWRETHPELPAYPRVFICEGEMDWLTVATHAETATAIVLGVKSESWDVTIAGCIPTGSEVYILTHSDDPGCRYRDKIAASLTGRRIFVRHGRPPVEKQPDENDRLKADPAGYSPSTGCVPYEPPAEEPAKAGKEPSIPVDDQLLALAMDAQPELIVDQGGEPYLVVGDGPVVAAIPAKGEDAETWLRGVWDDVNPSRALRKASVSTVLETLSSRAARKGRRTAVYRRVGRRGPEGSIWSISVDLCDGTGESIEADGYGWRIVSRASCSFARSRAQLPLPRPQAVAAEDKPGVWEEFFRLVRVPPPQQPQVVGWLFSTLIPLGPYPLLTFGGEQGSAKSTAARILRSVVDPSATKERRAPEDEEAMIVAAKHAWIVDYDNLSSVPVWMSDLLCQFSTGGSYTRRKKYTDTDEMSVRFQRPVLLTGIPDLATRGDLVDRAIVIHLEPIVKRLGDEEIAAEWAAIHPKVLGMLLDGVVALIKNGPAMLAETPRLADFYRRAEAAASAMGLVPGSVVGAYTATQGERKLATLDGDPTFVALDSLLDPCVVREGEDPTVDAPAPTMLMGRMCDLLDRIRRQRPDPRLPQSGNGLEAWLRRHGAALREVGIHSAKGARGERGQIWKVWRGGATPPENAEIV